MFPCDNVIKKNLYSSTEQDEGNQSSCRDPEKIVSISCPTLILISFTIEPYITWNSNLHVTCCEFLNKIIHGKYCRDRNNKQRLNRAEERNRFDRKVF